MWIFKNAITGQNEKKKREKWSNAYKKIVKTSSTKARKPKRKA